MRNNAIAQNRGGIDRSNYQRGAESGFQRFAIRCLRTNRHRIALPRTVFFEHANVIFEAYQKLIIGDDSYVLEAVR
jgi:hypothetical protein